MVCIYMYMYMYMYVCSYIRVLNTFFEFALSHLVGAFEAALGAHRSHYVLQRRVVSRPGLEVL
jgi:hypothetical protein